MSDAAPTARIRVGAASRSEPEFVKAGWYPKGLATGRQLPFYAQHFDYVELNSSFYAPAGFLFDPKIHRLFSRHATKADALPKNLQDPVKVTDWGNVILTPALKLRSQRLRPCGQSRRRQTKQLHLLK